MPQCLKCPSPAVMMSSYCRRHQAEENDPVYKAYPDAAEGDGKGAYERPSLPGAKIGKRDRDVG